MCPCLTIFEREDRTRRRKEVQDALNLIAKRTIRVRYTPDGCLHFFRRLQSIGTESIPARTESWELAG